MLATLFRHIDGLAETVVDLQRSLVAIPALGPQNGGPGEKDKADFLRRYLEDLGIADIRDLPAPDASVPCGFRPNIAARLPGANARKTLWIISHLDVVPPGDRALWATDPYTLVREGDMIVGRGVEDNHQAIASSLMTAKALLDLRLVPELTLGLLLVSDEETGSAFGLEFLLREHAALFGPQDLFLVPDSGVPDSSQVEVAEKSMLWIKFAVLGKQCHGSTPDKGINTLVAASDLVLRLRRLYGIFGREDPLYDPPRSTFEPTKKEANVENVNTIPGRDVFYVDCRVLPDYPLDDVLAAAAGVCREVEAAYGVRVETGVVQRVDAPPATPADSEIVRSVLANVRRVYGGEPRPQGIGAGTVAAMLRKRNLPAVVWATLLHNAHQPNERSSLANTLGDAKVMAGMLFPSLVPC
jgi:succinyl-diaminopimelate desuccinylase